MFNNYNYNFIGNDSSIGILINETTTKLILTLFCDIITFNYDIKSKEKEFTSLKLMKIIFKKLRK
jgi:hypothetical protein